MKKLNIQSIGLFLSAITASFFILSLLLPKIFVSQQYACAAGYVQTYNECEKGNPTACSPGNVGNIVQVFKYANGSYCCGANVGACATSTSGTAGKGTTNSSNSYSGTGSQPVNTNNATVGMACGNAGSGKCSTTSSSTYGSTCDTTSQGVCAWGGHGYVCCSPEPVNSYVVTTYKQNANIKGVSTSKQVLAIQSFVSNGTVAYDAGTGQFSNPTFPIVNMPAGDYYAILHVDGHLSKQLTNNTGNTFTITSGQKSINVSATAAQPGDVAPYPEGDNYIDLQDYNYVMGCLNMKDTDKATATCPNPRVADLNKDGVVDQKDISLVAGGFGTKGNFFVEKQSLYTCVTDPTCAKSGNSMQLCTLKCTKNPTQ